MAMENRIEILKADVQQKVGRNIILFQQVEAMLNFLAAYGEFSPRTNEEAQFEDLRKRLLITLAGYRQELMLEFLARCQLSSADSLLQAVVYLDGQMDRLLPEVERLQTLVKNQQAAMKEWAAILDGKPIEELLSQHETLIRVLDDYARMATGEGRWVPVFDVSHRLSKSMPQEMSALEATYGSRNLLSLIRACGKFEVNARATDSRPEYWFRLKA
ncbi:hypothetical protein [Fluviicoccus keumensis]|nr:hypothetical protein [Fluviicoccus keumensis]